MRPTSILGFNMQGQAEDELSRWQNAPGTSSNPAESLHQCVYAC